MTSVQFDLTGQTAIVTGSARGLGEGIAMALARAGANVIGVDRIEASAALQDACRQAGVGHRHVVADLRHLSSIDRVIAQIRKEPSGAQILVNNAGIIKRAPALETSVEDWDEVIDVNLRSVFFLSREFAKQVVERSGQGKIINIASMLSFQGSRNVAAYTASKTALLGVTRLMANELAPSGINVNAIAPGYMDTENTAPLMRSSKAAQVLSMIPAGRWGKPEDLGGPIIFLASRASDYVNGAVLPVDGGWLSGNF